MSTQHKSYILNKNMFKNRKENGFTLVEVLVVISIIAVIGTVVATLIINATQSNQKFSASNMTQSELLDSVARVTTQVSVSNEIMLAEDNKLKVKTMEDGIEYETIYFYWANDGDANLPAGVDKTKLPNQNAFLEYKLNKATSTVMVTNLISNYNREAGAKPIFSYFTNKDEIIATPVQVANLSTIKRVSVYFAVTPSGREAPMELATSAVPRLGKTQAARATGSEVPIPQQTVLSGTLPPGSRDSTLTWTSVAGATQYNLYRDGALIKASGPTVTSYVDPSLNWGQTYVYHAIVTGYAGQSGTSNTVSLTVVPEKPAFVNLNVTKLIGDVNNVGAEAGTTTPLAGAKYTVARNLTNQLSWTPRSGATGYKVVDSTGRVVYDGPNTTFLDPRNYGDVTKYRVTAYNVGQNGSGGNSIISDEITLISPPKAPTAGVTANDNTAIVANSSNTVRVVTTPANTNGFIYQSGTMNNQASTSEFNRTTGTSVNQNVGWGSTTYYGIAAYNDAGIGPESTLVVANQKPGPFDFTDITQTARSVYTNNLEYDGVAASNQPGSVTADWGDSAGRSSYDISVGISDSFGGTVVAGTNLRTANLTDSVATTNTMTPGSIYYYTVRANAANGTYRDATTRYFQTAPDVPRNGTVWIVCNNTSSGQYLNHVYSSDTRPLYGGADRTYQTQFSNNGGGYGLDKTLGLGQNSERTNSDGYYHLYTSGFILQNKLDLRAGVWKYQEYSAQIRAYGTYYSSTAPNKSLFNGCGTNSWAEPTDPCYGNTTWYAGCGLGKGRPNWGSY